MDEQMKMIKEICLNEKSINPIEIVKSLMKIKDIPIHGPIHHIIDGYAFLTAMHNAGVEFDFKEALDEMEKRGKKMPGATCGQWGICGSGSSVGAALAIIHQTTPLSDNEYYKDNLRLTSLALGNIAEIGGPRCCKRNAYISLKTAIQFVKEHYNIVLDDSDEKCEFSKSNQQCIRERCPFYQC